MCKRQFKDNEWYVCNSVVNKLTDVMLELSDNYAIDVLAVDDGFSLKFNKNIDVEAEEQGAVSYRLEKLLCKLPFRTINHIYYTEEFGKSFGSTEILGVVSSVFKGELFIDAKDIEYDLIKVEK